MPAIERGARNEFCYEQFDVEQQQLAQWHDEQRVYFSPSTVHATNGNDQRKHAFNTNYIDLHGWTHVSGEHDQWGVVPPIETRCGPFSGTNHGGWKSRRFAEDTSASRQRRFEQCG